MLVETLGIAGTVPRLASSCQLQLQTNSTTMDLDEQQSKFAIHAACREGQSTMRTAVWTHDEVTDVANSTES
jgi:hypothetical protein